MEIRNIRTLNGPNFWSVARHKLVVMELDLQELEERPTNKIEGFYERITEQIPSMFSHRCSYGEPGGFFRRIKDGTWMGHVIEHIALEIQTLAGMECGFGRTREMAEKGVYFVVFSYYERRAGIYAAKAAVRIAENLIEGIDIELDKHVQALREIREEDRLGPSTGAIVEEAAKRKIPWIRLNQRSLVQLGYGVNQKRIQATVASTTSSIAVEIACDKEDTKALLEAAEIPVPKGRIIYDEEDLDAALKAIGYPLVLKPVNGNHGKGATTNIKSREHALEAFELAKKYSRSIIAEKFITGFDHRILVINYKFEAAAIRKPACVVGDGEKNIEQLIEIVNQDPRRGFGHEKVLTAISIDDFTINFLKDQGLTIASIPKKGEEILLKPTANLSTGGTAEDITDLVHPSIIKMCERIARIIGLDICGIDIMAPSLFEPLTKNGGAILEVNAAPGFRMHLEPTHGLPRNVAEPVIDMLFPNEKAARIPIVAISGTNGKTTTSRLIAHIAKSVGYKVGFTTTDGVYIQDELMMRGDCTGPVSAEFVLKDPTVDFAVLESARGGILRAGLGFHKCDTAVVTNVAPDHLGLGGIDSLEKLARVKSVITRVVLPHGHIILNADDDLVYEMHKDVKSGEVCYFSMQEKNPRILEHTKLNGLACVYESGYITLLKGNWKVRVEKAVNIPLTFGAKAEFNIANILGATLAAYTNGIKASEIRQALLSFVPSSDTTPGRMNIFEFKNFTVMCDYAHNAHGMRAIKGFLDKVDANKKIGIIAGVGDRRDEDIFELGEVAAEMFDEIIIRQDKNLRGRNADELINLLIEGVKNKDANKTIHVIAKEYEAVKFAIKELAQPGDFICISSDVIPDALEQIIQYKEEDALA